MKIAVLKERRPGETRVAATPETVKKFIGLACGVVVESGAGDSSHISDSAFEEAGASIAQSAADAVKGADVILKVARPMTGADGENEVSGLPANTILVSSLQALTEKDTVEALATQKVTAFAMELMPRISRAQSMDILSSQSNLSGYKAVIDAAATFGRAMPMMMTAAGTIAPARVLVFGAGVAGLQAIATAKRLGAVVMATDVRYAAKEQVESLGGKFIVVDEEAMKAAETEGGYAKEMSDEFKQKQADAVRAEVIKADIVITTALIPGRPAPKLVAADVVADMKPGSIIVDLAVESGGNVEGSQFGETVMTDNGVTIIGHANMPARLARDSSALFSRNLFNFLSTMIDKETGNLAIDWDDDVVTGTLVTKDGNVVHPRLTGEGGNS
ncbi:MAG: Re/Si-specific NAD(P)(+) transhydrogenase subunit alpha [Rhodospirillaceae bacterium]|jgi:H+-translocating NAD(P) transhydrogenase subunit alpha|nr:Re/Si-specific NAD(P)(+) transhydrogenase subunit alpha [Rhodospirillaceae bacterium]MBT5240694.1 Re/Si-specific NAD(P)(+) transhydrogenase subunit alpha [Rhodospirillaceae bacterium]MBT5565490.1 Re/Si-specific NAD(P)(+) transhydrogenase subunit alpha [Rhodospirillaceae bacterium]MBT6089820.1 Re/Si-specific NAD(P)(+) transhydrogenase subunit alpha [Rhodospirillaceae bacterium]MBT6962352.1 Re/Si-specific NAD(P)(+) transhydrogenase subunit alpha [Rhodospirillaceae bacterium]